MILLRIHRQQLRSVKIVKKRNSLILIWAAWNVCRIFCNLKRPSRKYSLSWGNGTHTRNEVLNSAFSRLVFFVVLRVLSLLSFIFGRACDMHKKATTLCPFSVKMLVYMPKIVWVSNRFRKPPTVYTHGAQLSSTAEIRPLSVPYEGIIADD